MADPRVRIIVEAVTSSAERQLNKLKGTVEDTGKAGDKSGRLFDGFKDAVAGVGAAVGIAAGAFVTLKKAYDFGKEGAAILQTRDSFDALMSSMGIAPDILGRLRDASLGTVDDMTIMSSTMTLLAGTSETLGQKIVEASPKLMEIAKAAQKLNPHLGTTDDLYRSLAEGIKRSSPLILDNLGLTIKVGDANEAYAKSLGKTVDELTAEERQMALLNAALEAGGRLIEQVGGSTESMADSFAQAEAEIKNAADRLKAEFAPVAADVVGFLADMVTGMEDTAAASEEIRRSAKNYDEYLEAVLEAARANNYLSESDIALIEKQAELGQEFHHTVTAVGILTEAQYHAANETDRVSEKWQTYANALRESQPAVKDLSLDTQDLAGNVEMVANMIEQRAIAAADEFKASMDTLALAMRGEFGDAIEDYGARIGELDQQLAEGEISQREYKSAVDELTGAFAANTAEIMFNIAQKQILDALEKDLIEDVNESGTAYDEATEALWALAYQTGLVDEATLALMQATQDATGAFIEGKDTASQMADNLSALAMRAADAAEEGRGLQGVIDSLQDKTITVTVNYTSTGAAGVGAHEAGGGGFGAGGGFQHGGQFMVRGRGGIDNVPVNFMATAGEVVTVTPAGGTVPANPNPTYNLTINTSAPAESALVDFHIMRALAGAN
ncbi:MAG: hypothetical protein GWN58_26770 [Anaerolineae bacterium]|nr:hypothetical protein [Anaerolineae bacterium]